MKVDGDKLKRLIEAKFPRGLGGCGLCGQSHWQYDTTIFELREFEGGNFTIGGGGSLLPVVTLSCQNCGNIQLLNALTLGIVDRSGRLV